MKCSNCGAELSSNDIYCNACGCEVDRASTFTEMRQCSSCGSPVDRDAVFCPSCGARVVKKTEQGDEPVIDSARGGKAEPYEKRGKTLTVVFIVLIAAIAAALSFTAYLLYGLYFGGSSDTDDNTSVSLEQQTGNVSSEAPSPGAATTVPSAAPTPENVIKEPRNDLYSSSLTYSRMPEIHNTVLTDDNTYEELKKVIEGFDAQCQEYMNGMTSAVPSYLKPGSKAYSQQVSYKQNHPNLSQLYETIDVVNSRQGGGYYYVWVTEIMSVNENGHSYRKTEHWVYKIENSGGSWYIVDYTRDPAF